MLRKASEILNLPIINLDSGKKIYKVENLLFCAEDDCLVGFVCKKNYILPFSNVKAIGTDALTIDEKDNKYLRTLIFPIKAPLFLPEQIIGIPIITENGKTIGILKDLILEQETGKIKKYEVSDGLLKDLLIGKCTVPVFNVISYGEDAVVINEI